MVCGSLTPQSTEQHLANIFTCPAQVDASAGWEVLEWCYAGSTDLATSLPSFVHWPSAHPHLPPVGERHKVCRLSFKRLNRCSLDCVAASYTIPLKKTCTTRCCNCAHDSSPPKQAFTVCPSPLSTGVPVILRCCENSLLAVVEARESTVRLQNQSYMSARSMHQVWL